MNPPADSTTALIIFIILIVTFLALIVELDYIFADHDYFTSHTIWSYSPQVCLQDIPRVDLYMTIRAVNQWEKAMIEYGKEQFNYNVRLVKSTDVTGCNIVVMQESPIINPEGGVNPIGLTSCYKDKVMCVLRIDNVRYDGIYYHDTIVHEMGHAIGIGHRLSYEMEGFPAVVMSNDIMISQAKQFLEITRESIDALIWFYEGDNYMYNYTIPHNGTWNDGK